MNMAKPASGVYAAVLVLAVLASLAGFFGGPALGDHEAIVALTARNMRVSGDWVLPTFMDQPWFRKPPLPYWMVAGASYLFPNDPRTELPVTVAAARLPSALAGLGTILLMWKLASVMFGRRTGLVAAVIASSTILFLLYSPNATAEMPLTFCCVWAYLHFWYAATARRSGRRIPHMLLFYVALGMGMLAKGPAPVAMVGLPLAIWWYVNRPVRVLARCGVRAFPRALMSFVRGLWPRTVESFTRLWLAPGLALFAVFFVPWMLAVAHRVPWVWQEWNWQYLQRAQGDYLDSRDRSPVYYLQYVVAFAVPWVFLLAEAVAAPFMKRYARIHRPLLYAGVWAAAAIVVMSLEPFKKPYYILPAMPGLILMMAVIGERFYSQPVQARRWMWIALGTAGAALVGGAITGTVLVQRMYPAVSGRLTAIMAVVAAGLLVSGAVHIRGRAWTAFGLTAVLTVGAFQAVWHLAGQSLGNLERARNLAEALADLPADARVLWADSRPDARVDFYFNRRTGYMIPPREIVGVIQNRKQDKDKLHLQGLARAKAVMAEPTPVYLIMERESYDRARFYGFRARVIATIERDSADKADKKDWLVLSNVS